MPSVDIALDLVGDSDFSGSLGGSVHLSLPLSGNSAFSGTILSSDTDILSCVGDSGFTAVLLQRKPFVPGPLPGTPPPNPFTGLQVGRQPAARSSSSVVNPNPPRTRKPPEEPER